MFDTTLRQMLAMLPQGATNDQIIWRLRMGGLRVDASELLHGLKRLSGRGEIVRDARGRWMLAEFTRPAQPMAPTADRRSSRGAADRPLERDVLYAATALCRPAPPASAPDAVDGDGGGLPEWTSLLEYYAATQRHDPRGQIEEFHDRHGLSWQLFRASGRWWSGAELRLLSGALPEPFREALAAAEVRTAALGWPVGIFPGDRGPSFVPALIVPADWRFEGDELVIAVDAVSPTLNPNWLRCVRASTSWSEPALLDALLPEGEEPDLAAVGERMKFALATLGAASLRPGELAAEVSVAGTGLRNAAGFFLPGERSFTKGAADNLSTLRGWDRNTRASTALAAFLEGDSVKGQTTGEARESVPLLSPHPLTPGQRAAAERALAGPVSVIQGPPGTGKSQVILSLLISAAAAGRTVLFAAKNHQAINEVEQRLKALVGDAPLLVRARDADGERDVSFLDALADIAKGETWSPAPGEDPDADLRALADLADAQARSLAEAAAVQALHVEACDLAERLDLFRTSRPKAEAATASGPGTATRFVRWLLSLLQPVSLERELPDNAKERQIEQRLAAIKKRLAAHAAAQAPAAGELPQPLLQRLPSIARRIATPDAEERTFAAARLKEIEFEKVKSAKAMSEEDARLVLRRRPLWAISTLSAPSRIPLVPRLFDYVIFDEASQCDVASALPLMARARNAVVVGDPMQLRFIPSLGNAAEHALMDAAGLPAKGRAAVAQSVNSLFDFTDARPITQRLFLADQFRSAPAIVDYLNADFYGGRLVSRKDDHHFSLPAEYKPGLAWEDIAGAMSRHDGGNVNKPEAERIADLIRRLAADAAFTGSVGVISPFNAQVAEIQKAVSSGVSERDMQRLGLRVATVDKWQGAEADIVFFSLVLAAGAPMSAKAFLQKERRRLNVAVSRARAVCVVVGDLSYARSCGVRHIEFLASRATTPWSAPKLGLFESDWERRLYTAMRARGLKPMPQHPVGARYLDFAIEANGRRLDIEVDGRRWHTDAAGNRKVADILRDREMQARGWTVLRFWVHELANDMEGCVDRIERAIVAD